MTIDGKQITNDSVAPTKLEVPYGAEFTYQPGGTPSGNRITDPWVLEATISAAALGGAPPLVYIDCSFESPAPWPIDTFLQSGMTLRAANVTAPAVVGLIHANDPMGNPHDGTLWFPAELDGVGVVNVSSNLSGGALVNVGETFGQRFTMRNGAYIIRPNDPLVLGLFITGNPVFDLHIENCQNPFQTVGAPASTGNVKFFGAGGIAGRALNLLMTDGGPNFVCNSFTSAPAGSIINVEYDDTVPQAQTTQSAWTGTVNQVPFATAESVVYAPAVPDNWATPPTEVAQALDELATPASGATGARPATPTAGRQFFDTTLGYPIWWSAVLGFWVNAAGFGPQ